MKTVKRLLLLLLVTGLVGLLVYWLLPRPVPVDVAEVRRGPMRVTIDEEGRTRVRDVYTVTAPIAGRLQRPPVRVGDVVIARMSEIAAITPAAPSMLDVRTRAELEAALAAARSAVNLAEAELRRHEAELGFATSTWERSGKLLERGTISMTALDKAILDKDMAEAAVAEAHAALELRRNEMRSAEARLVEPGTGNAGDGQCCVALTAPVSGTVLAVLEESETNVQPGTPILEIVVDLLSSEAVVLEPGAPATIEEWGGPPLEARLERVDPAAFTKVSALGIEEQRVSAILSLVSPREHWSELGHAYRIYARIDEWRADDVLKVDLSALFRDGGRATRGEGEGEGEAGWAAYRMIENRAVLTPVRIGRRDGQDAQVLAGLNLGEAVILYPSDRIEDGVGVELRP